MDERVPTDSPRPKSVLFETGEDAGCDEAACFDLLGVESPADVDVLFVTFTKTVRERLDAWKRHADAPPANVGLVSVDVGGSNGGDRSRGGGAGGGGPAIRHVSDPSDLTGVGIAISEFLSAWAGDGHQTVVCFESVTALLQYVDANRVFQFLNEVTSKFEQAGVHAHFHITPEAHEQQVRSVLASLFDDRVGADALGHPRCCGGVKGCADDPANAGATGSTIDPGSVAVDDGGFDASDDDVEATQAASSGAPDGTGAEDPAEVVSSIINGDTADDDGDAREDGDESDVDRDEAIGPAVADGDTEAERDASDTDVGEAEQPVVEGRPSTARRAGRERAKKRLQYVGSDSSESSGDGGTVGPAEADSVPSRGTPMAGDDRDRSRLPGRYALYHRTTATVIGVVVLLVLISVFASAIPMGGDSPGEAPAGETTATPEEISTAVETESTPTPEPTAEPTPASGSGPADGSGSSTPTATPEPTATPTPEPVEESDGDGADDGGDLTDILEGEDDGLTGTLSGDDGLLTNDDGLLEGGDGLLAGDDGLL